MPRKNRISKQINPRWWIAGTVEDKDGHIFEARKHRIFRYVEAWNWGRWDSFRPEYEYLTKTFTNKEL